jgi:CBS-domain-containing membrane protein
MYYTRCIHPTGDATALVAVIGGQNIHALGYQYILTQIAINTATILLVALLFNALFHWRRYAVFLLSKQTEKDYTYSEYAHMLILFMHSAKWTLSLMLPRMNC